MTATNLNGDTKMSDIKKENKLVLLEENGQDNSINEMYQKINIKADKILETVSKKRLKKKVS
jgi:hypothetical protein